MDYIVKLWKCIFDSFESLKLEIVFNWYWEAWCRRIATTLKNSPYEIFQMIMKQLTTIVKETSGFNVGF